MGAHICARMLSDGPPPSLLLPSLPSMRIVCWGRAPWSGLAPVSASLMGPCEQQLNVAMGRGRGWRAQHTSSLQVIAAQVSLGHWGWGWAWRPGPFTSAPHWLAPSPATPVGGWLTVYSLTEGIFGGASGQSPSQVCSCDPHLQLSSGRPVTLMPQAPSEVALLKLWETFRTTWLVPTSHSHLLPSNCFGCSKTPLHLDHHSYRHCHYPSQTLSAFLLLIFLPFSFRSFVPALRSRS